MELLKGFYFKNILALLKDLTMVLFKDYCLSIDFSLYFLIFSYLFVIVIILIFVLQIKGFTLVKMVGSSGSANNSQDKDNHTNNSGGVGNGSDDNSDDRNKQVFKYWAKRSGLYRSSREIFDSEVYGVYLTPNDNKFLCSRKEILSNFSTLLYKFDLCKKSNPGLNLNFRMLTKMYVLSFKKQPYGTEYEDARNFLINQINSAATNSNTELFHLEPSYKEITTELINNKQEFNIYQKIIDETIGTFK